MGILDVFNTDAFNTVSLTDSINNMPHVPGRLQSMGIFRPKGISEKTAAIEEKAGALALLGAKERGAPASPHTSGKRTVRQIAVPHIPYNDVVMADDVIGIRKFGSEDMTQAIDEVVADKLEEMRQSHSTTLEYYMAGALAGLINDSDGSTPLVNLFTEFGVSEVDVDFDFAGSPDVKASCLEVSRSIESTLGAAQYEHIHAICSDGFWDLLIADTDVKDAYDRYENGQWKRDDNRSGFTYGGITFENYRGSTSGVSFVAANTARFFPVGVPNLYSVSYAPANFVEAVGTQGLPVYAKQQPLSFDTGIELHTQSNPLPLCHRPAVLVKGTTT